MTYRSHDRRLPLEHVITSRARAARRGRVAAEIDQLLLVITPDTTAYDRVRRRQSNSSAQGGS